MTNTVQCGSSRIMFRAATGRNGTLTHVDSIFFTVRSSGVAMNGALGLSALESAARAAVLAPSATPSAPTAAPRSQSRRLSVVFIASLSSFSGASVAQPLWLIGLTGPPYGITGSNTCDGRDVE